MTVSKDSSGHWVPPPASVMAAVSNQSLNRSLPSPTYGGSKSPSNIKCLIFTNYLSNLINQFLMIYCNNKLHGKGRSKLSGILYHIVIINYLIY